MNTYSVRYTKTDANGTACACSMTAFTLAEARALASAWAPAGCEIWELAPVKAPKLVETR
jgi:hypothetical protein